MINWQRKGPEDRAEIDGLWQAWREKREHAVRERLIEYHLPFSRIVAAKLYRNRNLVEHEFDDYLQLATLGLIQSVDRYNPNSGASFTTFASRRIIGEVLDGVARLSETEQRIHAREHLLAERRASLAGGVKDKPNGTVFDQLADIAIGLAVGHILDETHCSQDLVASHQDNQYTGIEMQQLRERLIALVDELPEKERLVIKYSYFNHVPFEAVAQQWGVSRGRIAQLHRSALTKLRKASSELRDYDISF